MLRALIRLSAVVSSVCLLGGCISLGLHDTARTAPPGRVEYGGGISPLFLPLGSDVPVSDVPWCTYPNPELYARLGLSHNLDLGVNWRFDPGIGIDGKYRLASNGVDLAARLGAALHYYWDLEGTSVYYYLFSPRIVASRESEAGLPWTFNAGLDYVGKLQGAYEATLGSAQLPWRMLSLRAGAGLPLRSRAVRIMPEVDFSLPLLGSPDRGDKTESLAGRRVLLSLGISIGRVAVRLVETRHLE